MKRGSKPALGNPFYLILRLLSDRKSLEACIVAFSTIFVADLIFATYLFRPYIQFLSSTFDVQITTFTNIQMGYGPVVWEILLGFIFGTLVIVITFAAQNIPKLIDLYMEEWLSLMFIWFLIGASSHAVTIKLFKDMGLSRDASVVFNLHLLGLIGLTTLPYTFRILKSTKPHNVINQIISHNIRLVERLSRPKSQKRLKNVGYLGRIQRSFFEMLNQLDDLLTYVPFKEPKANIVQGIGALMSFYVTRKEHFTDEFFQVTPQIRQDISFQTLQDTQIKEVEKNKTFYEQKGLRLIGNVYLSFLETDQFELATLCSEQLSQIGAKAIQCKDQQLIEVIMLRFNTHFRFAIKHGHRNNEPRNLYNLVFHYGQFVSALVEDHDVANVKSCFFYLRFYSVECFKQALTSPPLAFILDTIASEMEKILILIHEKEWEMDIHEALLKDFLLLDNPQGVDRREVKEFFISKNSVRILQIGLGLYYLHHGLDDFAELVVQDTLEDLELMNQEQFLKLMEQVFNRLRFSGPTFWEDTDRGNVNIYYTHHADQIDKFQQMQLDQLKLRKTA